jgi:hypothetical protein
MIYTATILDTATGERRVTKPQEWPDEEGALYWHWTDGNFGCDCNRALEFARAGGATEEQAWAFEKESGACGGKRFRVPHLTVDGKQLDVDRE